MFLKFLDQCFQTRFLVYLQFIKKKKSTQLFIYVSNYNYINYAFDNITLIVQNVLQSICVLLVY